MKFKESFKKPLATFFIFILGIFAVSGLSYITTVIGAAPGTNPENGQNTFKPINTGSETQGRCKARDTSKIIRTYNSSNNLSDFYTDCMSSSSGLDGSSVLFTNGVFIKSPNTSFQITGEPSSGYKYGALYSGCTGSTSILPQDVVDRCGGTTPSNQPPTFLYGDVNMLGLIDQNQTVEKPLCISAGVNKYPGTNTTIPKGEVMVCQ